jgi:hypothetical protein
VSSVSTPHRRAQISPLGRSRTGGQPHPEPAGPTGWDATAVARALVVSEGAVEKHIRNIFTKLDLPPDDEQHRRVLAVLAYLQS